MNMDRHRRLESLFAAVIELPPEERADVLERECASDLPLRRDVDALVAAYFASGDSLALDVRVRSTVGSPRVKNALPVAGERVGEYVITRELARGGMGAVFLARDVGLDRQVAIKFVLHRNPDLVQRFMREARALARCRHDNVVVVHAIARYHGAPYMVLEYHPGQTLGQWRRALRTPPTRQQVIELMLPVVRALEYTHAQGIVHRDLKPANIMVTDHGDVKVLDFGLARLLVSGTGATVPGGSPPEPFTRTQAGEIMGTIPYMAPEQWRGESADGQTDLWAIGIILFELLVGRHPLSPYSLDHLRTVADQNIPMPSARTASPQLGTLADIIDSCLVKDRRRRLASARELRELVEGLGSVRSDALADTCDAVGPANEPPVAAASEPVLEFASVTMTRSGRSWVSVPAGGQRSPFSHTAQVYVQHDGFGSNADLDLDVTLLNLASRPVTLTHLGIVVVEIVPAFDHLVSEEAFERLFRGIPLAGKVLSQDTYSIPAQTLFRLIRPLVIGPLRVRHLARDADGGLADGRGTGQEMEVMSVEETAWIQLDDPVYLPAQAPYRFEFKVLEFASWLPTRMSFRLTSRTQLGEAESGVVETCMG